MIIKKSLKITLSALLLAAGVSAFAEGEGPITLKNDIKVTWEEFINVLKSPNTIAVTGDIEKDLPETSQVKRTWSTTKSKLEAAQQTLEEKKEAQGKAETAKEEAEEAVPALSGVEEKKSDFDQAKQDLIDKVAPFQNSLDAKNKELEEKQQELSELQTAKDNYETQKGSVEQNLTNAQNSLRALLASPALQKKTTTTSGTVGWLKSIQTAAKAFLADYNAAAADRTNDPKVYYIKKTTQPEEEWEDPTTDLTIAFTTPANTQGWTGPASQADIRSLYSTLSKASTSTVDVYVYLGPNYAEIEDEDTKFVGSDIKLANILKDAVSVVNGVASDNRFQTTTTVLGDYIDPTAAGIINQQIEDTEKEIAEYQTTLNGRHGTDEKPLPEGVSDVVGIYENIKTTEDAITTTTGAINTLKEKISELEQDVEDAENDEALNAAIESAQTAYDDAKKEYDDAMAIVDEAQAALEKAIAEVTAAQNVVTAAKETFEDAEYLAQAEANEIAKAKELDNYKTITLTDDILVNEATNIDYDGTIYAEGHVITNESGTGLFNTFTGRLNNAALNGTFAKDFVNGIFSKVPVWYGKVGRYYDDKGIMQDKIYTLGELGFYTRDAFGVNFERNELVPLTEYSKIYDITVYEPNATTQMYVHKNDDGDNFITTTTDTDGNIVLTEYTIPVNKFAKTETNDLKGFNNIFYDNGKGSASSAKVVITDREPFYCPTDILADEVEYDRVFTGEGKGQNAVCLPFELKQEYSPNILYLSTFDQEDDDKFYFQKHGESVDANMPALLIASKSFKFENLHNITIKETPAEQYQVDEGNLADPSKSYGLFKKMTREQFYGGAAQPYKVYALTTKGTFQPAPENTNFPALRMVIYSHTALETGPTSAPRRICFRDEFGNDITEEVESAIEGVKTEVESLKVVGGQGVITITAEADYGQVPVYSLDGKMIAMPDITEGTTTVNVKTGVYIVMGKKVLVK